jgi:hypothetical protein
MPLTGRNLLVITASRSTAAICRQADISSHLKVVLASRFYLCMAKTFIFGEYPTTSLFINKLLSIPDGHIFLITEPNLLKALESSFFQCKRYIVLVLSPTF